MKTCAGCDKELELDEFRHNSRTADGKAIRCFTCVADLARFHRRRRTKSKVIKGPLRDAVLVVLSRQRVTDFDTLYENLRRGRVMGFKDVLSDTVARLWDDGKIRIVRGPGDFRGYTAA